MHLSSTLYRAGIVTVLEAFDVINDFSCIGSVFRISSRQSQFRSSVVKLLAGPSGLRFMSGVAPPADDTPYRRRDRHVLQALLFDRVMSREFRNPLESVSTAQCLERGEELFRMLQVRRVSEKAASQQ